MSDQILKYKLGLMDASELLAFQNELLNNEALQETLSKENDFDIRLKQAVTVQVDSDFKLKLKQKLINQFSLPQENLLYSNVLLSITIISFVALAIILYLYLPKQSDDVIKSHSFSKILQTVAWICIAGYSLLGIEYVVNHYLRHTGVR
jgi:hypothetical protein